MYVKIFGADRIENVLDFECLANLCTTSPTLAPSFMTMEMATAHKHENRTGETPAFTCKLLAQK